MLVAVGVTFIVGLGKIEKLEVIVAEQTPFEPINVLVATDGFEENGPTGVNIIGDTLGDDEE